MFKSRKRKSYGDNHHADMKVVAAFLKPIPEENMSAQGYNASLKVGESYWVRQIHERIWRTCYIGSDPDDNLWLHGFGSEAMQISKMDLAFFDFQHIPRPTDD